MLAQAAVGLSGSPLPSRFDQSVYSSWTNTFGDYDLLEVLRFHSLGQTLRGFGPLWDFQEDAGAGRTGVGGDPRKQVFRWTH